VLFLDRSDINTDEIIPAKYLTEIRREALKPYLLEDLKLPGFEPQRDIPGRQVVVSRANFGCGSIPRARPLGPGSQRHPAGGRAKLRAHIPPEHVQLRLAGR